MPGSVDRITRAVQGTAWAILPEKLEAILELLELRAAGVVFGADEIRARIGGEPRRRSPAQAQGVAVLPIYGVISQKMNLMTEMSGGTSTEGLAAAFDRLLSDQDVGTIVFDVDSPGGSVDGVQELASRIFAARGKKRMIAVANPLMASAAYWIASAADEIVVTPSGRVGSIGVFMAHTDISGAQAKAGIHTTLISAGRYKTEANPYEPLGETARGALQQFVEDYYEPFVAAIARHRGATPDAVREGYGAGRVLTAQRAVAANLADRVATLEEVLGELGVGSARLAAAMQASAAAELDLDVESGADGAAPDAASLSPSTPASEAREHTMPETDVAAREAAQETVVATVGTDKASEERAAQIVELCAMHGIDAERAAAYVRSERSVLEVGREIHAEKRRRIQPLTPPQAPDVSARERRSYNVARAILAAVGDDSVDAGYEREVSQDIARRLGRGTDGIFISTLLGAGRDAPRAALDTMNAGAGTEYVFVEQGSFIDLLRHIAMVARLGATVLPGLQGDVGLPSQTAAGTASWMAEDGGVDVADSDLTTGLVTLTPHTLMSSTAYTRQLLRQSAINVDQLVRSDLAKIHALAVDLAAMHGTGLANQPTGIYSQAGVNSVAMGGAITFAQVVALETAIIADDAALGELAYITTPEIRGDAKTTEKAAGTAQFIWNGSFDAGEMNGYRAAATNQVSKTLGVGGNEHGIIFGHWPSLLIGEWGAFELIADPYRLKKQGLIEITSFQMVDVAVRYAVAFAVGTGLLP